MSTTTGFRTAKATETRLRKRNHSRDQLLRAVSSAALAKTDWQYAYDLDLPLPAVRLAFIEDPRFAPLMRSGKIAIPARTLKHPKWATLHLTAEERAKLPTVASENKLEDLLPVAATGSDALDADLGQLEADYLDAARRMPPRKARAKLADALIIFARIIEQNAETIQENELLKGSTNSLISDNKRLERENQRLARQLTIAEQKLARLSGETIPPMSEGAEVHPH